MATIIRDTDRTARLAALNSCLPQESDNPPIDTDRIELVARKLVRRFRRTYRTQPGAVRATYVLGVVAFYIDPRDLDDYVAEKFDLLEQAIEARYGSLGILTLDITSHYTELRGEGDDTRAGHVLVASLEIPTAPQRAILIVSADFPRP